MCDRQFTERSSSVTSDRHNYRPTNIYVTNIDVEENSDALKPPEPLRKPRFRQNLKTPKKKESIRALQWQARRSGTKSSPPPDKRRRPHSHRSMAGMIYRLRKRAHTVASQALNDTIPQNKEKLEVLNDLVGILNGVNRINRLPHWAHTIATQAFDDPMFIDRFRIMGVIRDIRTLTEILERIVKTKTEDPKVIREIRAFTSEQIRPLRDDTRRNFDFGQTRMETVADEAALVKTPQHHMYKRVKIVNMAVWAFLHYTCLGADGWVSNSWNEWQRAHKGLGLSPSEYSAMYRQATVKVVQPKDGPNACGKGQAKGLVHWRHQHAIEERSSIYASRKYPRSL